MRLDHGNRRKADIDVQLALLPVYPFPGHHLANSSAVEAQTQQIFIITASLLLRNCISFVCRA
jgi:hypothetical protein